MVKQFGKAVGYRNGVIVMQKICNENILYELHWEKICICCTAKRKSIYN